MPRRRWIWANVALFCLFLVPCLSTKILRRQTDVDRLCNPVQDDCYDNEECAFDHDRNDTMCQCLDGYVKNTAGDCESKTAQHKIHFHVEAPDDVLLPVRSVSLEVIFNETDADPADYKYDWKLLEGTGLATASSYSDPILHLSELKAGKLTFRVKVSNSTHEGMEDAVITVKAEKKPNRPPHAVIRPDEHPIHAVEGTQIILDAEGKQLNFKWTQDSGPTFPLPAMNTAALHLEKLVPGHYQFTDGATDTESADVEVIAERDDPPKAIASSCETAATGSLNLRLPVTQIQLCANTSTDDKGIVSYQWFRTDKYSNELPVDTSGTSSSVLTLTNVQANEKFGPYEFRLDVTDVKGQKDHSTISVFVNKAENQPPVANAGGNRTVFLPAASVVLDGDAKDDGSIVNYIWQQIDGPAASTLINGDKAKVTVQNLQEGTYHFRLTVVDDGHLNGSSEAFVVVQRSQNEPPVVRAPNVTVSLPLAIAVLNGSQSTDDAGIVGYQWTPADEMALDGSDQKSVLFVTGLIPGSFLFNFSAYDAQNSASWCLVNLTVLQGAADAESVELYLLKKQSDLTYHHRRKLEERLSASLSSRIKEADHVHVVFTHFGQEPSAGRLRAVFWAEMVNDVADMRRDTKFSPAATPTTTMKVIPAMRAVEIIRAEQTTIEDFTIESVFPLYCKLDCSGHGVCNNFTKQCVCDRFWMSSLFTFAITGRSEDCAWSSIYVFLISISLSVAGLWFFTFSKKFSRCLGLGSKQLRNRRRRRRYSPLQSSDHDSTTANHRNGLRARPKLTALPIPPSSDSMDSESDDLLIRGDVRLRERTPATDATI